MSGIQPEAIGRPGGTGPWIMLTLDRDPLDPKWLLSLIVAARPAVLDAAGRHTGEQGAADWAAQLLGYQVALVPVHDSLSWRVDEGEPR